MKLEFGLVLLPNPIRERDRLRALCCEVIGASGSGNIADSKYGEH